MVGMQNFQDSFETCKRSFVSGFLICMTVPLNLLIRNRWRLKRLPFLGSESKHLNRHYD